MSLISDGLSLIGAIKGNKAQKKQLALQQQQFDKSSQIADQQMELAKQAQALGLATQVDANGNVTYYDNTTNTWKSVLSFGQQQLQDASDRETLLELGPDATAARNQRGENATRRGAESQTASTLLDQTNRNLATGGKYSADSLAGSLALSRRGAVNAGYDDVQRGLNTLNVRQGTNADSVAAQSGSLAKARANSIAQTMGNPQVEALQLAQSLNNTDRSNNVGDYNTFATRASNIDNQSYNPIGLGTGLTQGLAAARANASGAASNAGAGVGNAALTLARTPLPDYTKGAGAMWGALGNAWSGIENEVGAALGGGGGSDIGSYLTSALKKRKVATSNDYYANL